MSHFLITKRLAPGLRSPNHQWLTDPQRIYEAAKPVASLKHFRPRVAEHKFYQFVGHQKINRAQLMSFGSADVQFAVEDCAAIHLVACFAGTGHVRTAGGEVHCTAGGCLLLPAGERDACGSSSNAVIKLAPEAVAHAAAAIVGVEDGTHWCLQNWRTFKPRSWSDGSTARQIHALIHYIDACAVEDPTLPAKLALDDVLHRQVAALLDPGLLIETPAKEESGERLHTREGKSAFDDLLDYIRHNLDQPLCLSDLEARSHYSRRALQYAFRQKLHCSPKQWIRQQRLTAAMEQLREGDGSISVQAIALGCGYRSLSLFSADFKRQFGCSPSRARRGAL